MIRTLGCSFLIVLTFVGSIVSYNVSGIALSKTNGDVSLEGQHNGFWCILPPFPENGQWTIINGEGGPGEKICEETFLKFKCHPGYDLTPKNPFVFCDTNWNPVIMPKCLRSTIILDVFGMNSSESSGNSRRQKRQNNGSKCTLPPFPKNGKWDVVNGDGKPGDEVDFDIVIKFQCHSNYKLTTGFPYQVCDTSWDVKRMPICLKLCPSLSSTPTTTLKCKDVAGEEISCSQATEGTYLTYQCSPYYEAVGRKGSLYCSGGSWDFPKPVCEPVCGKKVDPGLMTLLIGGDDTNKFEYPWIIAIYIRNESKLINNCSGTLIHPRIVLTAAHCVTDTNGSAIPEDNLEIGAGKLFNQYGDTRDIHAQYSKAARVIVHDKFRGQFQRFHYDIALIVTKRSLTLGPVVQPVCYRNIDIIHPHIGSLGELTGWEVTEDGKLKDTLRTMRVTYQENRNCTKKLSTNWYNFYDKICVKYSTQNKSVCIEDSGSGLVFLNPDDNRFYIHGVGRSPKIVNDFCNNRNFSLFTKVAQYYEWLDAKSLMIIAEDNCILPPFPENGKWNLENGSEGLPGDIISATSILTYSCSEGYKLSTDNSKFFCGPQLIPPSCDALCPSLSSTPTTSLTCKNVSGNIISCSKATEGTSLTYQCMTPYYEVLGRKHIFHCSGGKWDFPEPMCQPPCGKRVDIGAMPLAFGGQNTSIFEFPWITAIYIKHKDKFINNCGGTLINPSIVLTAAHCVTNTYGDTISEDSVEIGAGKYFNQYEDSRDKYAQYSKAARVIVHDEFRGEARRFQYDIALIVTKKPLTLGPVVQPVCYSNIPSIFPHAGSIGEVAGWGVTEDGKPSDTLKTLSIPYKDKTTCTQELSEEWSDRYNFDDKMCAGFYKQNRSVCQGDSGSGLVFLNPEDKKFYVHGIVSISPTSVNGFCNNQNNALFTKVAHYYEWMDEKIRLGLSLIASP